LGWLSECPKEGAPHPIGVSKSGQAGDDINRVAALLHHQPRGFDSQIFDGFGWRLTRSGVERSTKLAGTKMGHCGELVDGQGCLKILLGICEDRLNSVGLRFQIQQR
jgi:hypothetical protein